MNECSLIAINKLNVVYHNLQLIRHSVNELNYLLNHPLDNLLFSFAEYSPNYFTNLIDIHGRNTVVLLASLFEGDLSLEKLINYFESNINKIEFENKAINKLIMVKMIKESRAKYENLKITYYPIIKSNRDKIAAHQDAINSHKSTEIGDLILSLEDMNNLLPKIEKLFAKFYYSLTNEEYVIYKSKSFIDEGLHALYDKRMKDLTK